MPNAPNANRSGEDEVDVGILPVVAGSDTANALIPKSLVKDLASLPTLINQLCRRQDSMEVRMELVFTNALDCFFKRLDESAKGIAGSRNWKQWDIRGTIDESATTDDSSQEFNYNSPFVTPRPELNVNRAVFRAMKAVKNPAVATDPMFCAGESRSYDQITSTHKTLDTRNTVDKQRFQRGEPRASESDPKSSSQSPAFVPSGRSSFAQQRSNKSDIFWKPDLGVGASAHTVYKRQNGLDPNELHLKCLEIKEAIESLKHPQVEFQRPSIAIYGNMNRGYKQFLAKIVKNPFFDSLCAAVILLNSVLIGSVTERLTEEDDEALWMKVCAHICNAFFFSELVLRMLLNGIQYFLGPDRLWNIFDFTLVVFALIEVMMDILNSDGGASVGSGLKTIKMVRIIRIFRVFRFFRNLAILAVMIADSMKELMWALVMLSIIIYVFAIFFVSGASDFIKEPETNNLSASVLSEIHEKFGSLPRAVNSLILSMLGGISWGEVSGPLTHTGWVMPGAFFFYIFFTMLAVLNIITGVFVDNAVETAKTQREFLVQREMELKDKFLDEMRELFTAMDVDNSGTLSIDELRTFFEDVQVSSYFQVLGMDPYDIERLFKLIDEDGSGEVEIQEFLDGCMRLKGEAKSIDVHALIYETKAIYRTLARMAGPGVVHDRKSVPFRSRTNTTCTSRQATSTWAHNMRVPDRPSIDGGAHSHAITNGHTTHFQAFNSHDAFSHSSEV